LDNDFDFDLLHEEYVEIQIVTTNLELP